MLSCNLRFCPTSEERRIINTHTLLPASCFAVVFLSIVELPLYHKILDTQLTHFENLQKNLGPNLPFCTHNNTIYYYNTLWVPTDKLRSKVLKIYHDNKVACHPGISKTCELIHRD